jgi:hypothetical protein
MSLLSFCEWRGVFYHDPHEQLTSLSIKYETYDLISLLDCN